MAETPAQMEQRLLKVLADAQVEALPGAYAFEFAADGAPLDTRALAYVRDGSVWSKLAPLAAGSKTTSPYAVFALRFAEGLSAAGMIAWLAPHLKRTVDTGVVIVCGKDRRGGAEQDRVSYGVFDYWAVPLPKGEATLREVNALIARGKQLKAG